MTVIKGESGSIGIKPFPNLALRLTPRVATLPSGAGLRFFVYFVVGPRAIQILKISQL